MKKFIYITAFTILGVQLQFLVHSFLEIIYIKLLLLNFGVYSFGLEWSQLYDIHRVITVILLVAGIAFGFWQGHFWWKYIYVDKKIEGKFKNRKGFIWKILKY